MKLGIAVAGVFFVIVMVRAADWAAAKVLWIGAVMLALGWAALWLYHRRKLAALRDLEAGQLGGWRQLHPPSRWPKACRSCGMVAHDSRSTLTHMDPESSACAAHLARLEALERTPDPVSSWTASQVRGGGTGSVDTLTEEPKLALESEQCASIMTARVSQWG